MTIPEMLKSALDNNNWILVREVYETLTGQTYTLKTKRGSMPKSPKTPKVKHNKKPLVDKTNQNKSNESDDNHIINAKEIFQNRSSRPVTFKPGEFKNGFVDDPSLFVEDREIDQLLKPKVFAQSRTEVNFIELVCYQCNKTDRVPASSRPPKIDVDRDGQPSRYYCNNCSFSHSDKER
mgnify:CR=1 FL=1